MGPAKDQTRYFRSLDSDTNSVLVGIAFRAGEVRCCELKIIAAILEAPVIEKIPTHLGKAGTGTAWGAGP